MSSNPGISLRLLDGDPAVMSELQRVLEDAPAYAELVTGAPPGQADAQSTFSVLPPDKSYDDKFVFGVYRDARMIGCIDLIRGFPQPQTAHLGLLLIAESQQRRGHGTAAYHAVEDTIRRWGTCTEVRIGVVRTNAGVLPFWSRLGFVPTGEVKPYRYANVVSETVILVKPLAAG
jgi:GNAT superfamily N-acetyltransferase